jgi:ribonuclease E
LQILRIIQEESMKDNTAAVHAQVPVEVASFLLNEKRSEIAKIEIQQRTHVMLIPNKGLETPNYKLERLKHDDARLDNIQASYKMAEEIEDPTAVTRRSQEPTNRQSPVIKGVLPDLPAPHAEPRAAKAESGLATPAPVRSTAPTTPAASGFFGWLKNLFGGTETTPEPAKPATADKPGRSGDRRTSEGRNNDNRRGGQRRGEGRRGGEAREERSNEVKADASNERPEGGRGRGRGGRSDSQRRQETANAESTSPHVVSEALLHTPENPELATQEKTDGRRGRRRRNGRNTSSASDNATAVVDDAIANTTPDTDSSQATSATEVSATPSEGGERVNERRERRNRDRYGRERAPRADKADNNSNMGSDNAWSPEVAQPAVAPVSSTPTAVAHRMPTVTAYELPMAQLQEVASGSGLEWVNSNPERIAQVQAAIAAEPKPVHTPRERPAPIVIDEGPLVLVETKRDLAQMHMPFDEARPTA